MTAARWYDSAGPGKDPAPMALTPELDVLVRQILTHPEGHPWTLMGFGMLRTDLMGREYRLHVWDHRYQTIDVAMVHDHPWDLESLVLSGQLTNITYTRCNSPKSHWQVEIQPGPEAAQVSPPHQVSLAVDDRAIYHQGDRYTSDKADLHETRYVTGTVTLVRRTNRTTDALTGDRAVACWPISGPDHWVDARPQEADPDTVRRICDVALAMWGELSRPGGD